MKLKKLSVQISVFLTDGIMNPSKYKKNINDVFEGLFSNEFLSINIDGVPEDMPLVKCSSKDGMISYDFSRKRINFIMSFLSKNKIISFDELKSKTIKLINENLLSVTDISRIGVAFVYYYDIDDKNVEYWINKYKFPLTDKTTSELSYSINNILTKEDFVYNNIISISNINVNGKVVPAISVDFNNNAVKSMKEEQIDYIFNKCNKYSEDYVASLLNEENE